MRMIILKWDASVENEVEEVLSRVEMLAVPQIDTAVAEYLEENTYDHKYLTAIDIGTADYGIYEIGQDVQKGSIVKAYAHGKCTDVGDVKPGIYYIINTLSHIDYNNVRYWRVVNLTDGVTVTTAGYEIADLPTTRVQSEGFGNIMIDSGIMLSVYDNSEPGIALIVIGEKNENN